MGEESDFAASGEYQLRPLATIPPGSELRYSEERKGYVVVEKSDHKAAVEEFRAGLADDEKQRLLDEMGHAYAQYPRFDEYQDGEVFRFSRQFLPDLTQVYPYVALRANSKWYLTGAKSPRHGMTWAELVSWLVAHPDSIPVQWEDVMRATSWKKV